MEIVNESESAFQRALDQLEEEVEDEDVLDREFVSDLSESEDEIEDYYQSESDSESEEEEGPRPKKRKGAHVEIEFEQEPVKQMQVDGMF